MTDIHKNRRQYGRPASCGSNETSALLQNWITFVRYPVKWRHKRFLSRSLGWVGTLLNISIIIEQIRHISTIVGAAQLMTYPLTVSTTGSGTATGKSDAGVMDMFTASKA